MNKPESERLFDNSHSPSYISYVRCWSSLKNHPVIGRSSFLTFIFLSKTQPRVKICKDRFHGWVSNGREICAHVVLQMVSLLVSLSFVFLDTFFFTFFTMFYGFSSVPYLDSSLRWPLIYFLTKRKQTKIH